MKSTPTLINWFSWIVAVGHAVNVKKITSDKDRNMCKLTKTHSLWFHCLNVLLCHLKKNTTLQTSNTNTVQLPETRSSFCLANFFKYEACGIFFGKTQHQCTASIAWLLVTKNLPELLHEPASSMWPFDSPNGGHDSPLKRSRIKHPSSGHNRKNLKSWSLSLLSNKWSITFVYVGGSWCFMVS